MQYLVGNVDQVGLYAQAFGSEPYPVNEGAGRDLGDIVSLVNGLVLVQGQDEGFVQVAATDGLEGLASPVGQDEWFAIVQALIVETGKTEAILRPGSSCFYLGSCQLFPRN